MCQAIPRSCSVQLISLCSICALQTHPSNADEDMLAGVADGFELMAESLKQSPEAVSSIVKDLELVSVAVAGLKHASPVLQRKV